MAQAGTSYLLQSLTILAAQDLVPWPGRTSRHKEGTADVAQGL